MAVRSRLTPREGRRFAWTLGFACLATGALLAWLGHLLLPKLLGAVGGVLVLAGLIVPTRLARIQAGWTALGHLMGKVTQPLVLGFLYFLVITPMGLMLRVFGRNPLRHPERNGGFWQPPSSGGRSDLDRQF